MQIQNVANCDVSNILSAPTSAGALVQIDGISLKPSPFVSIDLEKKTISDKVVGGRYKIQLNGYIVGNSFDEVVNGGGGNTGTTVTQVLNIGKLSKCVKVIIKCGQTFIDGVGIVTSVSVPEGDSPTWVRTAQYTIYIDLYINNNNPVVTLDGTGGLLNQCSDKNLVLEDVSEKFSISIDENILDWGIIATNTSGINAPSGGFKNRVGEKNIKLSFSITAQGSNIPQTCLNGSGTVFTGLDAAEKYISCRLDGLITADLSKLSGVGVATIFNNALGDYTRGSSVKATLDFRTIEVDPVAASISLSGEITYRPNGSDCEPDVLTSVSVEKNTDNDGNEIRISGTITGLTNITYTNLIKTTHWWNTIINCDQSSRMANANAFFSKFSQEGNLKAIALHVDHSEPEVIVDTCSATSGDLTLPCISVSPTPTPSTSPKICKYRLSSSQVSRDYPKGSINFTFILSNKLDSLGIDGVTSVDINATHDIPRDSIVEITVPGRGVKGILTQNICCLTADRWTFDVNLTLRNRDSSTKPISTVTNLRNCVKSLVAKYITDAGIVPDPITSCWFITDNQETIGKSTYKYNVQYTKPSCP